MRQERVDESIDALGQTFGILRDANYYKWFIEDERGVRSRYTEQEAEIRQLQAEAEKMDFFFADTEAEKVFGRRCGIQARSEENFQADGVDLDDGIFLMGR